MRRFHELRLAVMMLTRLPMGRLPDPVPSLTQAAWAFPLVGLVTGGLGWAVLSAALAVGLAPLPGALCALAAMVWITGALHEDGLADFADGLGGGRDRAHCLEIMRDSRIGSYGVVAVVFALALKASALAELTLAQISLPEISLAVFLLTGVASRLAMLAVLVGLPPARADGLGQSAASPPALALLPGALVVCALAILLGPASLAIVTGMACAAGVVAALAHRRLRGQTGDVLGAAQSAAETAGLVVASATLL